MTISIEKGIAVAAIWIAVAATAYCAPAHVVDVAGIAAWATLAIALFL